MRLAFLSFSSALTFPTLSLHLSGTRCQPGDTPSALCLRKGGREEGREGGREEGRGEGGREEREREGRHRVREGRKKGNEQKRKVRREGED